MNLIKQYYGAGNTIKTVVTQAVFYSAGNGIVITNNTISEAVPTKLLTSADYNYPVGAANGIAIWKLGDGKYSTGNNKLKMYFNTLSGGSDTAYIDNISVHTDSSNNKQWVATCLCGDMDTKPYRLLGTTMSAGGKVDYCYNESTDV